MKLKILIPAVLVVCIAAFAFVYQQHKAKNKTGTEAVKRNAVPAKKKAAAPLYPLFEKGQTRWKIVVPADISTVNQYAVKEFVTAIRKISGVEIPVVTTDTMPAGNGNIVIGSLKDNAFVRAKSGVLKPGDEKDNDTISIRTIDGNLYLTGNNPRSATYAVYHFLRTYLDVRWFWPGDDGEFMPAKETFQVPEIAYRYRSPFRYRFPSPIGRHGDYMIETGLFRMYSNGEQSNREALDQTGALRRAGTHSIGMNQKEFEQYPECFALISGERRKTGIAGCWSNPQFLKLMTERHIAMIESRKADMLCAFPMDVTERCECADCTRDPDKSARWFTFYSKLIREIQKTYPDLRASGIAYQEYSVPPGIPVENMEYVEYCLSDRCYMHPMDDPACPLNKKAVVSLKKWQEKAPLGIYGYEFDIFNRRMYLPIHYQLGKTAKFFRDMKAVRLRTEYPATYYAWKQGRENSFLVHRLSAYIFCMTAWDPDLDVNELIRDFCNYVYGAGADAMYEYHTTMGKYWDDLKIHATYFLSPPDGVAKHLMSPERLRAMQGVLAKAEKAIAAMPDEAERKRARAEFAIDKHYFELWENVYYLAQDQVFTLNLPQCQAGIDFNTLDKLPVSGENGHKPTDVRMYWSADGLHFRVIAHDAGLNGLPAGSPGRDADVTRCAGIQFFVDPDDGKPYRHFGVNLAGGTFDSLGSDGKDWNPEWRVTVKKNTAKDRWTMEVFLPFAVFGDKKPGDGTIWKMNIVRNGTGGTPACGFPGPAYGDMDRSAIVNFSLTAKPGKTIAFVHRDPENVAKTYRVFRNQLVKNGWQAQSINGLEHLRKTDLNGVGLIVYSTYKYKIPPEVFQEKVLSAVKNGAVLFVWSYYWLENLPELFRDPTFKVDYKNDVATLRRYTWITSTGFASKPMRFNPNVTTPPGVLTPSHPECWEVLAKQNDSKGVERSAIICRPYGKGLVVISGAQNSNILAFLDNIFAYNKEVKR